MTKSWRSRPKRKFAALGSLRWVGSWRKAFFYSLPYALSLAMLGVLFGGVVAYAVNSPTFELGQVKILNIGISKDFYVLRAERNGATHHGMTRRSAPRLKG